MYDSVDDFIHGLLAEQIEFIKKLADKNMELGLSDKNALVLGASQGMGAAIAEVLAQEGCNVYLGARRYDHINDLAKELKKKYDINAEPYQIDLSDSNSVENMCLTIKNDWKIDILLNNTGGPPPSPSTGVSDQVWHDSLQSLLMSTIRVTEAVAGGMIKRKWGRILTIASSSVIQPIPNLGVSNTVRSALVGFSKTLSNEIAKDGVTVNIILPGRIDTERLAAIDKVSAKVRGVTYQEVRDNSRASIPAGRYGTVDEFAKVAVFLMSSCASYITGSLIRVDGGVIKSV